MILQLAAVLALAAPPSDGDVVLVPAFPDHPRYTRPLIFAPVPGAEGVHVIGLQEGGLLAFSMERGGGAERPYEVLDLRGATRRNHNEEGLLGLAFHPGFAANGRLFLHYSTSEGGRRGRLSEFSAAVEDGVLAVDAGSERVVLELPQPYGNHNGGSIEFGPDGMLYVAFGDGGAANDPHGHGQDLSTLLGAILRIDVDTRDGERGYGIPDDNPFVDVADARGEIWAFGLRNVWRFSFDAATGALWAGDVGQNKWEEIDVVVRGGNYGWRRMEGLHDFDSGASLGPGELIDPVAEYGRSEGWSVTGGHVYRGADVPALAGKYVYGDYESGRIWTLDADDPAGAAPEPLLRHRQVASFGVDAWGELYVLSFDKRIWRFARPASDASEGGAR